jgi:hypothetical protein
MKIWPDNVAFLQHLVELCLTTDQNVLADLEQADAAR